jgi:AcrR family transcriptional regulator
VAKAKYHSPLRARQAAQTRASILDAALGLFAERGWAATTVPMIAERAEVSPDTIYAVFGTKAALLMAVVDLAIVGDEDEDPMVDRADFAVLGEGPRPQRVRAGVRYTLSVYGRSVPILRTLREAAASDATARERYERYGADRRRVIASGMALILGHEADEQLVDAIWALLSPETTSYLLEDCGWPPDEVEDWFVAMAEAAISRADP